MGVCVLHPLPQDRLQDCCFVYQKNIEGFVYKRKFRKFALAQKNSQVKSGYDPPYLAKCASYTQEPDSGKQNKLVQWICRCEVTEPKSERRRKAPNRFLL